MYKFEKKFKVFGNMILFQATYLHDFKRGSFFVVTITWLMELVYQGSKA